MVLRQRPSNLLVLGGMLAAFLIAAAFRWLTLAEFSNDHFDHVALAQQLRLGALPVRDFTDEGLPLTYMVSALAWTLVKTPFLAEGIVVVVGFALTAALSLQTAVRASHSLAAAALAVAAQVALYPRTYSYPKLLVQAIAVAVAWWAVERLTGRPVPPTLRSSEGGRIAALSAATALGYYFRHDHALYLGLAMIALLIAANWRTGWSTVARSLTLYAALVAALVLPHLAYVQWAAGVPTYFAISREYVRAEAGGGAYRLPVPYVDARAGLWLRADTPVVNVRWAPGVDDRVAHGPRAPVSDGGGRTRRRHDLAISHARCIARQPARTEGRLARRRHAWLRTPRGRARFTPVADEHSTRSGMEGSGQ